MLMRCKLGVKFADRFPLTRGIGRGVGFVQTHARRTTTRRGRRSLIGYETGDGIGVATGLATGEAAAGGT